MRKVLSFLLFLDLSLIAFRAPFVFAQSPLPFKDSAQIIFGAGGVGTEPNPGPGGGLGPGEFKPPFKCGLSYVGGTYEGHSPYAVDFNRAPFGAEDRGDPVRAIADGKVAYYMPQCGQVGIIHEGGYRSTYVHMRNVTVRQGQRVALGEKIGEISDTSDDNLGCHASGPHLHIQHAHGGFSNEYNIKIVYDKNPYPESIYKPPRGYYSIGDGPRINGQCP